MSDAVVEELQETEEAKPKRTTRRRTAKTASAEAAAPGASLERTSEDSAAQAESKKPVKRATRTRKAAPKASEKADGSQADEAGASSDDSQETGDQTPKRTRRTASRRTPVSDKGTFDKEAASAEAEKPARAEENDDAQSGSSEVKSSDGADKQSESASANQDSQERYDDRAHQASRKNQRNSKSRNHTKNDHQKGGYSSQKGGHYRSRRQHQQQNRREPVVPQTSKEDLAKLKVVELRTRAEELGVDHKGLKKAELVEAVFAASVKAEGFIETAGVLDVLSDGYGFLRTHGYLPSENDVYVGMATIRRNNLRKGDYITGQTRPARPNEKYAALQRIDTVNDVPLEELGKRVRFADLTPVFPDERLVLEHGRSTITARVIDLCAPIGKGQRGLIVSPPKAGKTTILKDIAASIAVNNPEVHLMCLLVDERPEEVTDMERSIHGEVISSTFDMPSENHVAVSEMVIERAKRLVENGKDVVILLDSLTRLARAYNLAQPASGRILSGGVDSTALYPPKKFLGAARNIEGGGSLTILASALIETGSKMDEVIFEEFKGTGNMEVKLDRQLADRRIFPAIDPVASGTRREDLLLDPQEAPLIWAVRRVLANRNNIERATDSLIKSLQQTKDNQEFLLRAAKKAQGRHFEEGVIEF